MSKILENPLFQKLMSLGLPIGDFAVFGSGPMFAHGLKDEVRDVDVIARSRAWEMAKELGTAIDAKSKVGQVVTLFDGGVEIYNDWANGAWDIGKLIDEAVIIDGIRFVRLEEVVNWKKLRNEPKDLGHINLIEKYLASQA